MGQDVSVGGCQEHLVLPEVLAQVMSAASTEGAFYGQSWWRMCDLGPHTDIFASLRVSVYRFSP